MDEEPNEQRERLEMGEEPQNSRPPLLLSFRIVVFLLSFFGYMNLYMQRINLSVAIVCMVNHTSLTMSANSLQNITALKFSDCETTTSANSTQNMEDGELQWSKNVQGLVLGSFFWGYLTTQVLGGALSLRFGGSRVFGMAMLIGSVATLAMPPAARLHFGALMALRIIIGMCGGVVFPAGHTLFARWAPPLERSRLIGISFAGCNIGTVVSLFLGGYLCRYGFAGGWPSVFYVFGILGIIWFILWTIFVTDSPRTNRWIGRTELNYIDQSLENTVSHEKVRSIPWFKILTSKPVWAIVVTHTCANWSNYMFLTQFPTYLREVVGFTITKNGVLSALPYLIKVLVVIMATHLADSLFEKKLLGRTTLRKLYNSAGEVVPAVLALATTFLPCALKEVAVAFLITGISFTGFLVAGGYSLSPVDIAPEYSGIVFGISNTAATIPGMIGPSIVGAMTPQRSRVEWNNVFYLTAAIYVFGTLSFVIFGSGKLQDWGVSKKDQTHKKMLEENNGNTESEVVV